MKRSPPAAVTQRFQLRVVAGLDSGKIHVASADRVIVGSHVSADLALTDETVARFHCEIASAAGKITVRDLESRQGTIVDGVSILHAHLRNGASIQIGKTQLQFELGPDQLALPVSDRERFGSLVGRSVAMRRVFAALEQAAAGHAGLLLEGETGTGKEVVADSVHRESARKQGPFVVVDCGAIPSNLLESELFGHERGAFTGAVAARAGAFEEAHGGTLFLDEIGELAPDLQPKLLRILERREIKRVGSNRYFPVDVRVIAATNRNLFADVNNKHFRADLYYRLAVLNVRLPPLRERAEDLPILVEHLLAQIGATGRDATPLRTDEFLADLAGHSWPGNVRELRNYLERCVTFKGKVPMATTFTSRDETTARAGQSFQEQRDQMLQAFERRYAQDLLRRCRGNMAAAAREAGMNRVTLYRMLWKLGLK